MLPSRGMRRRVALVGLVVSPLFGCGLAYRGDGPLATIGVRSDGNGGLEPVFGAGYQHQARRALEYNANANAGDPPTWYHAYNAPAYEVQARLDWAPVGKTLDVTAQGSGQVVPFLMGMQLVTATGVRVDLGAGRVHPLWLLGVGAVGFDPRVGSHGGQGPPPPCGYSADPDCRAKLSDYTILLDWSLRLDFLVQLLAPTKLPPWDLRVGGSIHRQAW